MYQEHRYPATVRDITDGDTIDLRVHLPFHLHKDITVRLLGVDTAETYGVSHDSVEYKRGKEQTAFVREWIEDRSQLYVRTDEKGSFGRWLGEVFDADGNSLNDALLREYPRTDY